MSARPIFTLVVLGVASCAGAGGLSKGPSSLSTPSQPAPRMAAIQTPAGITLPAVEAIYDDPRLAGARAKERSHDFEGAAAVVAAARQANPADPRANCAWAYVEGRLWVSANQFANAVRAFDSVWLADVPSKDKSATPAAGCGIALYARLRSAQAAAKLNQWDVVLDRLAPIPNDFSLASERTEAEAEARAAKGARVPAVVLWRRMLAAEPFGSRWVDTSAKLATAILDGVAGDPKDGAREAYDLATRVLLSAPRFADVQGAPSLRARAAAFLRDAALPDTLTPEERAKQVQAWLDTGDVARAASEANLAFTVAGKSPPCKLALVRAQAITRTKQSSELAWVDAIAACEGQPEQVAAYFGGGKASSGKRPDEARERFAKVEQHFPKHRLADDARLLSALLVRDTGDDERFAKMLLAMPEDYPEGDMRAEGLFRVALERMKKGEWRTAMEPLERTLSLGLPPRHASVARATYFLGRCAEADGLPEKARARYVQVVQEQPLTYPMLLAYRRLAERDVADARRVLDEAVARERDAIKPTFKELDRESLARAARLMEVGELEAAKKELTRGGFKEGGELAASLALLFSQVGAFDAGVAFARKADLLGHYPNERWRYAWEASYPRAHEDILRPEAVKNGIPVSLAWGIMREESAFVVEAKSSANAFGLMQLIIPTAKMVAQGTGLPFDEAALKRADINVTFGTKLLGQLRSTLGPARTLAPAAYNAGGGALGRWRTQRSGLSFDLFIEEIPYEETRNYVKKVLSSQAVYAFLYAREELDEVLSLPLNAP